MKKLILGILVLSLVFSLFSFNSLKAQEGLDATKIAELTKPAVVFIETIIEGDVTAPSATYDDNFRFTKDPQGGYWKMHAQTGVSGSGFIVTPDGYVVTNAHVVKFTDEYMKYLILQTIAYQETQNQIKEGAITEAQAQYFAQGLFLYLLQNAKISNITETVYSVLGKSVPGVAILQQGKQCEVKKVGDPIGTGTQKDVAILKIESNVELPTVKIGDSSKVATGEHVFCVGYPGVATYHPALQGMSATIPTVTGGIISAIKEMPGGWSVLQTDAAIYHGNSGGPAFNSKGEAIGIATFGSIDYNTGQTIEGFNFLVPINIATEFLKELGVNPHQGTLDKKYEQALKYYWNGYYSKALQEFTAINQLYPAHPYANEFIQKCRQEIEAGHDKKEVPMYIILIFIGVLLVLVVLFFVMRRQPIPQKKTVAGEKRKTTPQEPSGGETVIMGVSKTPYAYLVRIDTGESFNIKDVTNIGRSETNDIILPSPAVSKEHAKIKYEDGQFVIYDLASTNGTYVNGVKINKRALSDGDEITFGDVKTKFKIA
jgi:S1-C subfamily serine protease